MTNEIKIITLGLALGIGFIGCSRESDNQARETTTTRDSTTTNDSTGNP